MQFHQALSRFELQVIVMALLWRDLAMTPSDTNDPSAMRELAQRAANLIAGAIDWSAAKVKEAEKRA